MKRQIPWPRILAEGTAIVVSILLAFAIDAWWEERKAAEFRYAQLQTLLGEFREAETQLDQQLGSIERSLQGTLTVLALVGPNAPAESSADFRAAVSMSLNVGLSAPQLPTVQDVLRAEAPPGANSSELRAKLQTWTTMMGDLAVDAEHLESNREADFIDALIRVGVSLLSVVSRQADLRVGLPESSFNGDLSAVRTDPGVETVFAMRALRSQILIDQHRSAIELANDIIGVLEGQK